MSETSVNLSRSHRHKEKFLEILDCNDRETAKEKMQKWIYNASNCGIPQFEKCAHSIQNRLTGILNSFSSPHTNDFTELNRNMMFSIDIVPIPMDEAVREVENRLLGVETNISATRS